MPVRALAFQELMAIAIEKSCRELLLAAVRDSTDAERLRSLAEKVADWDGLIDLALQHCVLPMLFLRLNELVPFVPTAAIERIHREYERIVVHNLANAAELVAVLECFNREGIQAMPFKGVVLAASAYGDLLKRPGGDLDVLVRQSDLARSTSMLRKRGYELETQILADGRPKEPKSHEYKFRRQADGRELELRWRLDLNWGRYGRVLGVDWVWPQHSTAILAGARVPVLNPELSLLVLCMHGCKHDWSRLIWVCDVERVIATSPQLKWPVVLADARYLGLRRALGLGVLLAKRMLQANIPGDISAKFEEDRAISRLADHFAVNILENPGIAPRGRIPYGFQLLDMQDRVRFFLSGEYLRPTERDRDTFRLPGWLWPLYYLLRPIRLMWDRSPR